MQIVSFKLAETILAKIDRMLKPMNFNNRTEFIREAVREKLNRIEVENDPFIKALNEFKGAAKVHVTDEQLEKTREKVGREYAKKFGINLD